MGFSATSKFWSQQSQFFFAIVQSTVSDLFKDSNPLELEGKSPGSSSSLKYCWGGGWHGNLERCLWTSLFILISRNLAIIFTTVFSSKPKIDDNLQPIKTNLRGFFYTHLFYFEASSNVIKMFFFLIHSIFYYVIHTIKLQS